MADLVTLTPYRKAESKKDIIIRQQKKQIKELEQKLEQTEKDLADYQFNYSKIKELEKENSKLKEKENTVHTLDVLHKEAVRKYDKTNDQLVKAKEHIRTLISCLIDWVQEGDKDYCYIADAEQFLKGENIILEDAQVGNSPFDADEVFNKEMKAYPEKVK